MACFRFFQKSKGLFSGLFKDLFERYPSAMLFSPFVMLTILSASMMFTPFMTTPIVFASLMTVMIIGVSVISIAIVVVRVIIITISAIISCTTCQHKPN
jgi:hypothetical protein